MLFCKFRVQRTAQLLLTVLFALGLLQVSQAQKTDSSTTTNDSKKTPVDSNASQVPKIRMDDDLVVLPGFEVTAEGREGYYASNSIGASRLSMPVQDLPLSIQIVTDELIKDMAALRVEDSLRYVSGVNLQNRNDTEDAGETYNIRGFKSRMLLRNGIPFNAFTDNINTLQLEVVKGPSSVLYGVSDPGGLVNVVTKKPLKKEAYNVDFQVGSWDLYRSSFDATGPITADKRVSYRLMGVYEEAGSFRPFVADKKWMLDGVLRFDINERNRIDLEYVHGQLNSKASSRRGIPVVRAGAARSFPDPNVYGIEFTPSATPHDFQDLNQQFSEAVWESQLSENVRMRLAYAHTVRDNDKFSNAQGAINNGRLNKLAQREQYVFDQDNLYFDVVGTYELGSTKNTTLAGVQYRTEEFSFYNALWGTQFGGPFGPPVLVFDPTQSDEERYWMPPLSQMINLAGFDPQIVKTTTQSAFVTHQIGFMENRLRLTAGVRYDDLKSIDTTATTPQLGIVYKLNPDVSFFVSYNESFVPNTQIDVATGEVYDPEEGRGMDVGVKYRLFNGKLAGSASVFEVRKTNVVNFNSRRDIGEPEYLLSGRLRNRGFEFDGIISPVENLQVIVAYAYYDAVELENAQYPDFVPYQLDNSSKNNLGIWTKYRHTSGPLKGLAWGGGYSLRTGPINLFPNGANRDLKQDTYDTFDFFVRYTMRIGAATTTLSLNVNNAFDELYMNKTGWYANPRNVLLGVGFEF